LNSPQRIAILARLDEINGRTNKRIKSVSTSALKKLLVAALDEKFSLLVRILYPTCFFPGCNKPTEDCFHFFTRAKRSIRWELDNATGSCKSHNILYEQDQAFIDDVRLWFVAMFGQPLWDYLKLWGNHIVDWDNDTLLEKLEWIVAETDRINKSLDNTLTGH
jgi:hypothetical protein